MGESPVSRWIAIGLAVLGMLPGTASAEAGEDGLRTAKRLVRARFHDVPQLQVEELRAWLEDAARPRPVLLDVRGAEEFAVSHLAGARRADSLSAALGALEGLPKTAPVVAYCSVGYRSSALVRQLQEAGYVDVYNLEGSIFEWANQGHPVEREGRVVGEVHPYAWPWSRYLRRELHAKPAGAPADAKSP